MESNQERIQAIYESLQTLLPAPLIVIHRRLLSGWCSLVLPWNPLHKERGGFAITVPRDLNLDKYLCETCFLDAQGYLYSPFPYISWISDMEKLLQEFYSSYLYYRCLQSMCFHVIKFQLRKGFKRKSSSLLTLCLTQLSTYDLHMVRRHIMLLV